MQTEHTISSDMDQDMRTIPGIDAAGRRYPIDKMEAHRRGVLHEAVSVFLFDGDQTLLQKRAAGKYHCGGLWANACCTHPDWGEEAVSSARRRLREELGIDLPLREVGHTRYKADVGNGLTEHEDVRVFCGHASRNRLNVVLNPAEVSEVRWVSIADLKQSAHREPEHYAPWLLIYLTRWETLGLIA